MPITMGGMASGIEVDQIVKKLVDVEARPMAKYNEEKELYGYKKQALGDLSGALKALDNSIKDLYGFRASYDDKKIVSSDPSIVDATVDRQADKGERRIRVLQLASTHKIATDQLDMNEKLPAGVMTLKVGEKNETLNFRGGNLRVLRERIDEKFSSFINTSLVNTYGNNHVLTLQSKVSGEKGEILITGDEVFLKKIGLVSGSKNAEKDTQRLVFDNKYFVKYSGDKLPAAEDGSLNITTDGKSAALKGILWREYQLGTAYEIKRNSSLVFRADYKPAPDPQKEDEALPYKVEVGPTETTVIKGIELDSYNISRERTPEQKKPALVTDDKLGIGVVYEDGGVRTEKIFNLQKDATGEQEIPIGETLADKKITSIIFYCNEGEAVFSEARLVTPQAQDDLLAAKNTIDAAKDARMKIEGVEIVRDRNDGLNDVMKGVTLSLNGADEKRDVILTIDNDIEKAIKKIQTFVEAYNQYLALSQNLTHAETSNKPNDFNNAREKSGIFVGDMMIIRLQNAVTNTVSSAYPSRSERPLKMLSMIGINTGAVNSRWADIKGGALQIDNELLKTSIIENPEGVKDLFGADTDGDNRVDNGFAFTLETVLKPYVQAPPNIISAKVDQQDEGIKRANENIARLEDHLKSYEEKLRAKFSTMEQSIAGARAQQNWMRAQNGGGNGDQ